MSREDRYTHTERDAALFEARHALPDDDDRPSAADLADLEHDPRIAGRSGTYTADPWACLHQDTPPF